MRISGESSSIGGLEITSDNRVYSFREITLTINRPRTFAAPINQHHVSNPCRIYFARPTPFTTSRIPIPTYHFIPSGPYISFDFQFLPTACEWTPSWESPFSSNYATTRLPSPPHLILSCRRLQIPTQVEAQKTPVKVRYQVE